MAFTTGRLELIELGLGDPPAYAPRWLPGGKTTWSHSCQSLAERCPALWKRRYLDKIKDPPTAKMVAGGAFGAALERVYSGALLGEPCGPEQAAELAAAVFDERALDGVSDPSELGETRAQTIESLRAYARERTPIVLRALGDQLRAVERRFDLRMTGVDARGRPMRCEWAITGYLDLEAADEVRDFKLVGTAHPGQAQADRSPQGGLYLLARAAEGEPAARFVLDSTRRAHSARSRTPRFAEVPTSRSPEALVALQRRIAATALLVAQCAQAGSWPYAATSGWWCAAGQCAAWPTCAGGGRAAGSAPALTQDGAAEAGREAA